jgi:hypothetical protein
MFNECAKVSKQIGQNLYKKINLDKSNSEDIRCGFKAALKCLKAAVYLLMDVLKAHNLCTKYKLANMSVVSSYHSTITEEVRDQSDYKKTNAFRDLIKAQNDKANKLEALIEIGDLTEDNYADLGRKGIVLHQFIQDHRQAFHEIALAKAYGPNKVRPGGPKRFEQETRYAASTTTIEPMWPIELYKTQVDRDQQRLSSRLQRSIQEQIRSNKSTRPKAHYAPFKDNYNGHVTGNSVYCFSPDHKAKNCKRPS